MARAVHGSSGDQLGSSHEELTQSTAARTRASAHRTPQSKETTAAAATAAIKGCRSPSQGVSDIRAAIASASAAAARSPRPSCDVGEGGLTASRIMATCLRPEYLGPWSAGSTCNLPSPGRTAMGIALSAERSLEERSRACTPTRHATPRMAHAANNGQNPAPVAGCQHRRPPALAARASGNVKAEGPGGCTQAWLNPLPCRVDCQRGGSLAAIESLLTEAETRAAQIRLLNELRTTGSCPCSSFGCGLAPRFKRSVGGNRQCRNPPRVRHPQSGGSRVRRCRILGTRRPSSMRCSAPPRPTQQARQSRCG